MDAHTAGRPIVAPAFGTLSDDQVRCLHEASLEIMARLGQRFHHEGALAVFAKAGFPIDDGNLVRIPHQAVERALATAPRRILIFDREGRPAMDLAGRNVYFGPGSDCMYLWDVNGGQRRAATLTDLHAAVRVADWCPNISYTMSMYLPSDVAQEVYDRYQMQAMLAGSAKPVVFVNNEVEGLKDCWEMAEIVAGGREALQRKPLAIAYANATSPTQHNREALDKLLFCAERGLPIVYVPGSTAGLTGPVTAAGSLAMGNAANLGAIVLSQLVREGTPIIRGTGSGSTMDMKTLTKPYASPDQGSLGWELLHAYGLPGFGIGGASDAKLFDAQAAAEAALTLFNETLQGANLVHDVGYLEMAMNFSLELLVTCDETIGWLRRQLQPVEITPETLALDVICAAGPDGGYLQSEHTLRHFRENWYPALADRGIFERWAGRGSTTLQERANRQVRQILETHRPEPLPADVAARLDAITQAAVERYAGR